jgi:UDP-N-acetyl-D-glucosamine dehydrogenase
MHLLKKRGSRVTFSDPFVDSVRLEDGDMRAESEAIGAEADCVVIITDHKNFDYAALVKNARLIVDTRNALKTYKADNIVRL